MKQGLKWGGMAYRLAKFWAMTIPSTKGERWTHWERTVLTLFNTSLPGWLGRVLDQAGHLVSFWAHVNLLYRIVSYLAWNLNWTQKWADAFPSPARIKLFFQRCCIGLYGRGPFHYPHPAYLTSIGRLHGTHHRNLTAHTTAAPWTGTHIQS